MDGKGIEDEARGAIESVVSSCRGILERLKATERLESLYEETRQIIDSYKWRFSTFAEAALDTGTGVLDAYTGMGGFANSMTRVVSNTVKSEKVIKEISQKVKEIILNKDSTTPKTGGIFSQFLDDRYKKLGAVVASTLNAGSLNR